MLVLDLSAASDGSTRTSKPRALPRAVPSLRALPTLRQRPRQARSVGLACTCSAAACSSAMLCLVAATSCRNSCISTITCSLRSSHGTSAMCTTNCSAVDRPATRSAAPLTPPRPSPQDSSCRSSSSARTASPSSAVGAIWRSAAASSHPRLPVALRSRTAAAIASYGIAVTFVRQIAMFCARLVLMSSARRRGAAGRAPAAPLAAPLSARAPR